MQVSGHHGIVAGIFYIIAQLSGACFGILLLVNYQACAAAPACWCTCSCCSCIFFKPCSGDTLPHNEAPCLAVVACLATSIGHTHHLHRQQATSLALQLSPCPCAEQSCCKQVCCDAQSAKELHVLCHSKCWLQKAAAWDSSLLARLQYSCYQDSALIFPSTCLYSSVCADWTGARPFCRHGRRWSRLLRSYCWCDTSESLAL